MIWLAVLKQDAFQAHGSNRWVNLRATSPSANVGAPCLTQLYAPQNLLSTKALTSSTSRSRNAPCTDLAAADTTIPLYAPSGTAAKNSFTPGPSRGRHTHSFGIWLISFGFFSFGIVES